MAAPLFSQVEIDNLIAVEKRIRLDEWQAKAELKLGRPTAGWSSTRVRASASGRADLRFVVELRRATRREEFSMTLLVSTANLKDVAIVRYDLQTSAHQNPQWHGGQVILARAAHRHAYNPEAVTRGVADDWDRCAEALRCPSGGNFDRRVQWLKKAFLDDLMIQFDDRDGRRDFLVKP